jgi:hypothetical protein
MIRIEQVQAQVAAPAAALGVLDFRIQQVQTELVGFRAEVHTELETIKSDISGLKSDVSELKSDSVAVKTSLVSHGELLQKILDRLPAN